jgi:hypothetical protein
VLIEDGKLLKPLGYKNANTVKKKSMDDCNYSHGVFKLYLMPQLVCEVELFIMQATVLPSCKIQYVISTECKLCVLSTRLREVDAFDED